MERDGNVIFCQSIRSVYKLVLIKCRRQTSLDMSLSQCLNALHEDQCQFDWSTFAGSINNFFYENDMVAAYFNLDVITDFDKV